MGITLWNHFENVARRVESEAFKNISTLAEWEKGRPLLLQQFQRSLGLHKMVDSCDLATRDFGGFKGEGYTARKVAYQMLPDCWTSATIYCPDPLPPGKLPAVLHLCGHGEIGIYHYQERVTMLAKRGYVVMIIDTIEQHDAGGDHHGTFSGDRFDWISMGYTAAGGEVYNGIRALDLLTSLPEVDTTKIGTTGASGGGAQSFFLTVFDERVKALATCCGVTMPKASLLERHFHEHCDCMYPINVFQRCMSEFAALIAPRAALYNYASEDNLFSPYEYHSLVERAREIYRLHGCEDNCQLFEYPGPHGLIAETHARINLWFDKHLIGEEKPLIPLPERDVDEVTVTIFNGRAPAENKMRIVPELLSHRGGVELPDTPADWPAIRGEALERLRNDVFHNLEKDPNRFDCEQVGDWELKGVDAPIVYLAWRGQLDDMDIWARARVVPNDRKRIIVSWCEDDETSRQAMQNLSTIAGGISTLVVEGRTGGWNAFTEAMEWDYLRAGSLIGLTPTMIKIQEMQIVMAYLQALPEFSDYRFYLYGRDDGAVASLYHAAFNESIAGVVTEGLPGSHCDGAYIPSIIQVLDICQASGLLAPRPVALVNPAYARRNWARRLYERLGLSERYIRSGSSVSAFQKMLELDAR